VTGNPLAMAALAFFWVLAVSLLALLAGVG
jgi:hypothetical protein